MNLTLPSLRGTEALTHQSYEDARLAYLADPSDDNRLACARAAERWAKAQEALSGAVDEVRRHEAAAAYV